MIKIDLLIVGDASDGPEEEITSVESLDHFLRLFGFYSYDQTVITSGATGATLSQSPWADTVLPLQYDSSGTLVTKRLFEFRVNGVNTAFSKSGSSSVTVVFRYPTLPGNTSLIKGVLAASKTTTRIHVLRLGGGTHATSPSSGGFVFTSQYPGSRYNATTVLITGTTVTLTPAPGTGKPKSYSITSDFQLVNTLRDEVARGFQSIFLTGPASTSSITIPSGTYILTGGTNGQLTASKFNEFLENHDLSGVDVVCPVGLTTQELSGVGIFTTLAETDYPTLIVAQAPSSGVALSGYVNTQRNLCSVAFDLTYDVGDPRQRVDDAAPLVAAIIGGNRFGLTLAPLLEGPPSPRYDQAGLHALAEAGHTTAFKSISKDWALWHVVTGDSEWAVSTFRAFQEIVRPVYEVLEPVLGNVVLNLSSLDDLLTQAFSTVEGSQVLDWSLDQQGDTIYADINFQPFGEVRVIRAQIALGTPQTADLV